MLAEIYDWFTEGFEFADLKDAKALLDELGSIGMRCSKCGTENPAGKKFCAECGAPLAQSLPELRFGQRTRRKVLRRLRQRRSTGSGRANAASRPQPRQAAGGVRVTPERPAGDTPDGERKTVTALFADIKGSMELMEDLDPEEARAIVDPALRLMIDAVHRYDGYIVQSTGDGIFALFGAPVAHEDHPQRALYAALRMQEDLRRYSDRLRAGGGLPIQARAGVNTGEVVVRSITTGEGHTEYTPIGHTANLASRMQTLAPVGSVAVTEATRKLCEGYFAFKSLGPTTVKGVSEPVNVAEVTGLGPLRTRLQVAAQRGFTKFVGRQAELEQMKHALELARDGPWSGRRRDGRARGGQVAPVLRVQGGRAKRMPGAGSLLGLARQGLGLPAGHRPAQELFRDRCRGRRAQTAREGRRQGRDSRSNAGRHACPTCSPCWAFRERRPVGATGPADQAAAHPGGDQADTGAREPQPAADRRCSRTSTGSTAKPRRCLICWWTASPPPASCCWSTTAPSTTINGATRPTTRQLRLDPLGKESAQELLTALMGDDESTLPLKRLIIERTEGNPFFMEEMVQALFEQGVLARNGAVKLVKPLNEIRVPPTVQAILASRIDRLPAAEKELLQTLAVLGREFSSGLIKRVAGKSDDELERMLSELQLAEFIYEQPAMGDVEYTFKHALTLEVGYNSVLVERRRLLHERAAQAIEALFADRLEDHLSELAHHYDRSGNARKAVEYLGRAGRLAAQQTAHSEAVGYFKRALELLKNLPDSADRDRQEFDLQMALSWSLFVLNPVDPEREPVLIRARELSEQLGEDAKQMEALLQLAHFRFVRREYGVARELAQRLLGLAEPAQATAMVAGAHYVLGTIASFLGELEAAREHLELAVALFGPGPFRNFGEAQYAQAATVTLTTTLLLLGYPAAALRKSREFLDAMRRLSDPASLASGLVAGGYQSCISSGQPDGPGASRRTPFDRHRARDALPCCERRLFSRLGPGR